MRSPLKVNQEVPLPRGVDIRAGQEIRLAGEKSGPYLRYFMVAASFLIFFLRAVLCQPYPTGGSLPYYGH
jgi:hypothetical protein